MNLRFGFYREIVLRELYLADAPLTLLQVVARVIDDIPPENAIHERNRINALHRRYFQKHRGDIKNYNRPKSIEYQIWIGAKYLVEATLRSLIRHGKLSSVPATPNVKKRFYITEKGREEVERNGYVRINSTSTITTSASRR